MLRLMQTMAERLEEAKSQSGPMLPALIRRHQRLFAAVIVLAVLMTGLVLGWRWMNYAAVFAPTQQPSQFSALVPGQTIYSTLMLDSADENNSPVTVFLTSARPNVAYNSANATVSVLKCTRAGETAGYGTWDAAHLGGICASMTPLKPGDVSFGPDTILLLAITAHTAGQVSVDGIDVEYTTGLRRGHQTIGDGPGLEYGLATP